MELGFDVIHHLVEWYNSLKESNDPQEKDFRLLLEHIIEEGQPIFRALTGILLEGEYSGDEEFYDELEYLLLFPNSLEIRDLLAEYDLVDLDIMVGMKLYDLGKIDYNENGDVIDPEDEEYY